MKKVLLIILGSISLVIGTVAAVIPLLPSFPFLLLAFIAYGKSSEKLNNWFISTKLYKENLESLVSGQGMTKAAKIRTMITITILLLIGSYFMGNYTIGRIILLCIWIMHLIIFTLKVKTLEEVN